MGMDIVTNLTTTAPHIRADTQEKFIQARNRILSNRRSIFPYQLQLALNNFPEILHDTPAAVFADSCAQNDTVVNKMLEPGWMQLYYHSASPMGTEILHWD